MTEPNIPYRRLLNHRIAGGKPGKPEQAVLRLGALQAQDYHQALWAVGLRTADASVAAVERSIEDGKILLTWLMRGTIHMVPAEDAKWMLKLLAPRVLAQDKRRLQQLELTPEIMERGKHLVYDALRGHKRVSRTDLMHRLKEAGIRTDGQRGYHMLWHFAQEGLICLGPKEGKQQTFALLEEWVSGAKDMPPDAGLAELAVRYYQGHGPATVPDFAWWTGMTLADARKAVELARSLLMVEKFGGQEYWLASSSQADTSDERTGVYLIPGFDEYLLGYKDRGRVLKPEHAPYIVPGGNGVFMPTVVIDGQVAGLWKRTVKKKGIDIEIRLFVPGQDREEGLIEAAGRYCAFMEQPLVSTDIRLLE
ncbi:winged helix DNA-binding domain-containing protein [Cohnella sp. CFH 77786]|uniref:winged helix DNA-binding domain-containing protein n=1 Tax=Cohnella sp. CFH 77786 TaxID=2662265 RepID=UPI001C6081D7|nr:winged helix DNA-binding domain-containing protein [Cohnella sp. CFH 77786]